MRTDNLKDLTQRRIKELHLKQIYLLSLRNNGISRAQLKREMQLSFPSVSALVDELIEGHILEETGITSGSTRGRPGTLLRVCRNRFAVPVVTMQYDAFMCRLFDSAAELIESRKLPYEFAELKANESDGRRHPNMESLCESLVAWINGVKESYYVPAFLLTTPGTVNEEGVLSSSSLRFVSPPGFIAYLEEKTGLCVIQGNSSDHYAYGEYHKSGNAEDFALILISQGVGAAVLRDGKIFGGKSFRAGEFGHISIDYRGKPCVCGGRGCLERYISIDAMSEESGLNFDSLCDLYAAGDPKIESFVNDKAQLLALGISNMLTMQPLEYVVLGGEIRKLGEKFLDAVKQCAGTIGFRWLMRKVDIRYSSIEEGAEAEGALWNYLDNQINISTLMN